MTATSPGTETKPRVLFLDDEERILKTMNALFRSQYEVLTATDGADALEHLKRAHVHAVVSDQRMPGMSGVEFLRKARQVSPGTVRMLLTGYSDLQAIVGSINDGEIFRYISKPWQNVELQATIAEAVTIGVKLANVKVAASGPLRLNQRIDQALLVLSSQKELVDQVTALADGTCEVLRARTLREAVVILQIKDIGVIVAEANAESEDVALFLKLLKQKYPESVTVLVTPTADAEGAIELINQAQLFRFLAPPVTPTLLKESLDAAISHALVLRATPELLARHTVQAVSKERQAQAGSWLLDGLRTLRSRLGLSAG